MKRLLIVLVLLFLTGQANGQNSANLQGVAPPTNPTVTSSTPLQAYTDQGVTVLVNGTGFVTGMNVTYNGASITYTLVSATQIKIVIPVGGVKLGNNPILVNPAPRPVLSMNSPVTLPNGQVGVLYSQSLPLLTGLTGGVPPITWTASGLPTGLSLSASGVLSGKPLSAGASSFSITATDSTGLTFNYKGTVDKDGELNAEINSLTASTLIVHGVGITSSSTKDNRKR